MSINNLLRPNNYDLYVKYSPSTPADWNPVPTTVSEALDILSDGDIGGVLPTTKGGTGINAPDQNTLTKDLLGFTTSGDMVYDNAGIVTRLPIGTNGQVLVSNGTIPTWQTVSAVKSVGLAMPSSIFSVSGSPVTNTGTMTANLIAQNQNLVMAAPNGSTGTPTFRAMANADVAAISSMPALDRNSLTGTLNTLNGGTGLSVADQNTLTETLLGFTATGDMVYNNAGTVSVLPIGTNNQVLTVSSGIPAWSSSAPGNVTSVGLSLPSIFTVSGSPVTTSGTLTGTLNSQSQNLFLASPNGSSGTPTFRAIVAADVPTLNQNTTGTASNVTGTVAIANGGTGQTTAAAAYNALSPMTTTGDIEYEVSAGTAGRLPIGNTGQMLGVSSGIPSWVAYPRNIFGSGVLGPVTISSNTTLISDKYYTNLTVNAGVTLSTGGFRIFCTGTCNILGTIDNSGTNASGGTGGSGGSGNTCGPGGNGATGTTSTTGANATTITSSLGGAGGSGGNNNGSTGGGTSAINTPNVANGGTTIFDEIFSLARCRDLANNLLQGGSGGAAGASSGGAAVAGGGGGAGGVIVIVCSTLAGNGNINANGGNGGNAVSGNSGGGGGGGGGCIALAYSTKTYTGGTNVNGGTHGAKAGTGFDGADGSAGNIFQIAS